MSYHRHPFSGPAGYTYANEFPTGQEKAGEGLAHRPVSHLKSFVPELASESLVLPYTISTPPGLSCTLPVLTPVLLTSPTSTRASTQCDTVSYRGGVRTSFLSSARSTKSIDRLFSPLDSGWIEDPDPFAASGACSFRIARSEVASHGNDNDGLEGDIAPGVVSQWYNYKSEGTFWRKRIKKQIGRVLRGIRSLMHVQVRLPWGARSRVQFEGDTYNS